MRVAVNICDVTKNNKVGIDAFTLKMIAAVTMLIDHTGYIFFPQYVFLRIIGRIAFPIFAFLIVEGFMHTRNVKKYIYRMIAFALITEIPFDFAFYGTVNWGHQNVLITFTLALLALYIDRQYSRKVGIAAAFGLALLAEFIGSDYGMFGVIVVMMFYWNYDRFYNKLIFGTATLTLLVSSYQIFDVMAMIPIGLYNGKKGIGVKYFFYVFYPGHLLILGMIHMLI